LQRLLQGLQIIIRDNVNFETFSANSLSIPVVEREFHWLLYVASLVFGLATLVFNGLEMAMHSMMQGAECLTDVVFVHPVLHGLFTFLQMHFLFVNSQARVHLTLIALYRAARTWSDNTQTRFFVTL